MRFHPNIKEHIRLDNSEGVALEAALQTERASQLGWKRYLRHLDKLQERIPRQAYRFFRFGFDEEGLHDGYLLDFRFGDALEMTLPKLKRLSFGKGPSTVAMTVLNYEKTLLRKFVFKEPRKLIIDIPSEAPLFFRPGTTLGQIYTYQLSSVSSKYLLMEWLLDSGGTISIEFETLSYMARKIQLSEPEKFRKRHS